MRDALILRRKEASKKGCVQVIIIVAVVIMDVLTYAVRMSITVLQVVHHFVMIFSALKKSINALNVFL